MGRKLLELLKSLVILLLAAAILVLVVLALPSNTVRQTPWLAALVRPFASYMGLSEAELTYTPTSSAALPGAAQPLLISVMQDAGRQSFQYDFAALDAAYEQYGSALAQALDSAESPVSASREEFLQALGRPGVAFRFPAPLSPALVAAWLGAQASELQCSADWYLLAEQEDAVQLYLMGESCCRAATGVSAEQLLSLVQSAIPDGSFFAFEDASGKFTRPDGLSLIQTHMPRIRSASAQNPCEARFISSMASVLGFNPYGEAKYVDPGGTTSFSETGCSLSVTAQGLVTLKCDADRSRFQAASEKQDARIEAARSLLSQIVASSAGNARVYLCGYEEQGAGALCTFRYYLSGAQISQSALAAATVRFSGTAVTQAQILLRTYALSQDDVYLLPAAQAAAIVREDGPLEILYADVGDEALYVNWRS